MIHKVRFRFVLIAMCALSVAMLLVAGAINAANWHFATSELRNTAQLIASNNGRYPQGSGNRGRRSAREASYETRYFCVTYSKGSYNVLSLDHISITDKGEATSLARQAYETKQEYGFIGDLMFFVNRSNASTLITLIDCETKLNSLRDLALISITACVLGIALSLLIVALFSRRAIRPLLENAESQKRFISDSGHELKTPLTVFSANMDLLELDMGENEWVSGTQRQVSSMRKLVNELIALSTLDESAQPHTFERFDLSEAVDGAAEPFFALAEHAGKHLALSISPGLCMAADEAAVRRLVSILLENALKYAPDGDNITLSLSARGRRAWVRAKNGLDAPIEGAELSHLFDRFYRSDPARAKDTKDGFGIGLAIAKAAAIRNGGRIWAQQSAGNIEFVCVLPLTK